MEFILDSIFEVKFWNFVIVYIFSTIIFFSQSIWFIGLIMMIAGLAFVATLAFEMPFAKLEMMLIGG